MKKGFSLAEVLITLGIIGVIASVTMPTLNNNIWKGQRGPLLKNAYERINNAFSISIQELGYTPKCTEGNADENDCRRFGEAILNNLRVARDCVNLIEEGDESISNNCQPNYKVGEGYPDISSSKTFYFPSGMFIINYNSEIDYFSPDVFFIDVNGVKGPNKWGQDLFEFKTVYARNHKNIVLKPGNDSSCLEDHSGAKGATAEEILRNRK